MHEFYAQQLRLTPMRRANAEIDPSSQEKVEED